MTYTVKLWTRRHLLPSIVDVDATSSTSALKMALDDLVLNFEDPSGFTHEVVKAKVKVKS